MYVYSYGIHYFAMEFPVLGTLGYIQIQIILMNNP